MSLSFFIPQALAASLKGEAYGKGFGPIQFNIEPGVEIGNFGSDDCDDDSQKCRVWGFSWSDVIGWTAWNGEEIQIDIENNGGLFLSDQHAKLTYNGSFEGFAWGDKTGWVGLSACNSLEEADSCNNKAYCEWSNDGYCVAAPTTNPPDVELQSADDWGVYVDLCELKNDENSCESNYCNWENNQCVFDTENNPDGLPVRGYAWSEHLGWIKFGVEPGDQGFAGVFIDWSTDDTPPEPQFETNNIWIPNDNESGTINWIEFAIENDSEVDSNTSDVDFELNPDPGYAGCNPQIAESAFISQEETKVNLDFPLIGQIDQTVSNGHCRYNVSGVIYNTSQIGYFFGSNAKERAANAGIDVDNPTPHVIDETDLNLFTLAGGFDASTSEINFEANAIADGYDALQSQFIPKDIGGNPIVNIPFDLSGSPVGNNLNNAVRNVYLKYQLDASNYFFDSVNLANNFDNNYPAPLEIETEVYPNSEVITYPKNEPTNKYEYNDGYLLEIKGLAPTTGIDNQLILEGLTLQTNTQEGVDSLPIVSPSMPAYNLITDLNLDLNSNMIGLPHAYNFVPALEVVSGELNKEPISMGENLEATFEIQNNSNTLIQSNYSLDHILDFEDLNNNADEDALEIINLNLIPNNDAVTGQTDRQEGATRYQLIFNEQDALILSSNYFHSTQTNYHEPFYDFSYDNDGVDFAGNYEADGAYYAQPNDEEPYPPQTIDRSDKLPASYELLAGENDKYTLSLTPSQYLGQAPDTNLVFNIDQYVAYKPNSVLQPFVIYPAAPFIDGIEVKAVGLGSQGLVGGEQIFEPVTGRDLEKITLTTSANLRKEMRRNVAQLTRNLNPENCPGEVTLSELPQNPSECVIVNESNQTIVAAFSQGTITLEGDGNTLTLPPDYKYTLILMNGANLNLKSNLAYSDEKSSLGIIALQNEQGEGGNTYIDPTPTNLVGLLYAEGSLLSSPDGGNTLYYGNGADPIELKNQLYWQGSIATRNTIGGAANNIKPATADCSPWNEDLAACSKAYDLDYIRRFSPLYDGNNDSYYSSAGTLFSGGGSCNENDPHECSVGALPSTVILNAKSHLDPENSKSLDTFFIERDNRPTPLGFTNAGSFISSQAIP